MIFQGILSKAWDLDALAGRKYCVVKSKEVKTKHIWEILAQWQKERQFWCSFEKKRQKCVFIGLALKSVYKSVYVSAVYGEFWRQRYFVSPYKPIPTIYTKEIGVKKVLHFFYTFLDSLYFLGPPFLI